MRRFLFALAGVYIACATSCRGTEPTPIGPVGKGSTPLDTLSLGQSKSLSLPDAAFPNPLPLRLSLQANDTVDVGIFITGNVSAAWLVNDDAVASPATVSWLSTRQQEGINNPFQLSTIHAGIVVPSTGVYAVKVNPHCLDPVTCAPRGPFDVVVRRSQPFVVISRFIGGPVNNWVFWPGGSSFSRTVGVGAVDVDTVRIRNAGARSIPVTVSVTGSTFEITPTSVTLDGPALPMGATKLYLKAKAPLAAGTYRDTVVFGGIPDDSWHQQQVVKRVSFVITVQ